MKAHLIEKELKKMVRLFDTFCGMPNATEYDVHQVGSFSDANLATAKSITVGLEDINIHVGVMPETFTGLESCQIDVAHVDVDNYLSVKACLEFIWPRMPVGGYIIIDDYNDASCFGAKKATNDFFESQHDLFNNKQQIITSEYKANPQAYIIKQ
jgi:O-methyltransferase